MEKKIINFIKKNKLIPDETKTVYVAVSGGADSMALLAFMHKNIDKDIVAVHVNHGIRGESADRDEEFVRNYCAQNDIPVIVHNARDAGIKVPENASEDWARNLRYNFFKTLDNTNSVIATAHTLSDQTETVLFRLARGCGLKGLCGIPVKRNNFIRPFLCITRTETEKLSEMYGTSYVTDETNLSDDYNRNKIRHHAVPVLKEINPQVEQNIAKLCKRVEAAEDFVASYACSMLKMFCYYHDIRTKNWLSTSSLAKEHPAVLSQILLQVFGNYDIDETIMEELQECILAQKDKYSESLLGPEVLLYSRVLSEKYTLMLTNKVCGIRRKNEAIKPTADTPLVYGSWNKTVRFVRESYDDFVNITQNDKHALAYYLNGDRFPLETLTLTEKTDGDEFKPACRYKTKIVKHMTQFSLAERLEVPILKNQQGEILYLYGTGFTDNCLPNKDTKYIYHIIEE